MSAQRHDAAIHGNLDASGLTRGLASQCILDPRRQVGRNRKRLQRDVVGNAQHATQRANHAFDRTPLNVPVEFAAQRHPAFFHRHLDPVLGHRGVPAQRLLGRHRNLGVAAFVDTLRHHVNLQRDGLHARHPLDRALAGDLFRVSVEVPA